ncbi:MAG: signal peptidase II [Candidatus Dadabacteria bacterium]|nr:signal peptidase II [Candidatus Dadabacteria bacterium]MCY4262566.1 signal peptidase II [Candidatus Dadabacteria bacterium]
MRNYLSVFIISFLIVLLDQLTKWLVKAHVPFLSRINVFSWFDITHLRNPGIAFGMLRDMPEHLRFYFYIVVFVLVLIVIFFFLRNLDEEQRVFRYALAFVLGGAIGNSIDRFAFGYVTDFLAVYWPGNPDMLWPPFNVADSAITIGAISILILGAVGRGRKN